MTLHDAPENEVGVREFHDHLSRYVRHVADGGEVIVTMRGKRIARLAPWTGMIHLMIFGPAAWCLTRVRTGSQGDAAEWEWGVSVGVRCGSATLNAYLDISALAAASRAGRIDARGLRQAVADLEAAVASIQLIGVDAALAREAGRLAAEHALRGYDAVHLATALSVDDPALVVVTWDVDLARAALRCGRSVAPALVD
jgi:prevent-host-death family protein